MREEGVGVGIRSEARHHRLGPVGTGPYPLANGQSMYGVCLLVYSGFALFAWGVR